jgi:glycine/D-amino acid oxidase-like deaminating enzyme
MVKKAQEMGVDIHFKTALVQLIRKDNGRVTGAVTTNENGEYVKINASQGDYLCTGGFSRDAEMVSKLCPRALATSLNVAPPTNTGEE